MNRIQQGCRGQLRNAEWRSMTGDGRFRTCDLLVETLRFRSRGLHVTSGEIFDCYSFVPVPWLLLRLTGLRKINTHSIHCFSSCFFVCQKHLIYLSC